MEADGDNKMSIFTIGQVVVLKSDKNFKGVIVNVIEGSPENRYQVFSNNERQTYYESQLEAENNDENQTQYVGAELLNANITASLIRTPSLSSLYSLNIAKIDYIPHQFRPILKFIHSDRPRLLIADGVGVGKTIEAGLILKEMQARRNLDSVLIICPRPLVSERKWEIEMERFGESFTALDGEKFRYCINELDLEGEWPEKYKRAIIPYSLFDESNVFGNAKHPGLIGVDPPKFDLVIVDEAHHIRNTATYAYKAVDRFCESAEAVVLLTATPVQLEYDDLFVLLNILRPDLIIDKKTFTDMAEPNDYVNKASEHVRHLKPDWKNLAKEQMIQASMTSWGSKVLLSNPTYKRVLATLNQNQITDEERVQLISNIESLHTFSNMISRTRRRDIGEFTLRKPYTVKVDFTDYQRELHNRILSVIDEILKSVHCTDNTKFMMTTIRRQTASCLFGLVPMLESILYRHADEIIDEEMYDMSAFDIGEKTTVRERIECILQMASDLPSEDPKFDSMLEVIQKKNQEPKNKIMIFSSFKHTLRYLEEKLEDHGYRVGMVNGDVPDEDRRILRKRFNPNETPSSSSDALDILLFSEVGCEGLDYQFCDCMINYDLPWNPMKVEQRIGRIDRNGQTSERVAIYNMITPGTVDADIYERCLMRIGVFKSSIGDCESVLGEVTGEINKLANDFSLTEDERREKLQQMTDNKIRSIKEEAELEENQKDLFGIQVSTSKFDDEVKDATNFWLSTNMLQNLILSYLNRRLGIEKEYLVGNKKLKHLRISQEGRLELLNDFKQRKYPRNNDSVKAWKKWLESGNPILNITFDSNCWNDNPDVTFVSITHPLTQMAAYYFQSKEQIVAELSVKSDAVPAGRYPFAVYQWKLSGEREDVQLKPIAANDEINDKLLELLKNSYTANISSEIDTPNWDSVDNKHYDIWKQAQKEHKKSTNELINYKEASLKTSHAARIAIIQEQLSKSNERNYTQMTQGKLRIAQEDFEYHMSLLNEAKTKSDILVETLAYGILDVKN